MLITSPKEVSIKYTTVTQKQQEYLSKMQEAVHDNAFILRTMDAQNDFEAVDEEGMGAW